MSKKAKQETWKEKCAGQQNCYIEFEVEQWRFVRAKKIRAAVQTAKGFRAGYAMTTGACAGALEAWNQNALASRKQKSVSRNRVPGPHQTTDNEIKDILALVNEDLSMPPCLSLPLMKVGFS